MAVVAFRRVLQLAVVARPESNGVQVGDQSFEHGEVRIPSRVRSPGSDDTECSSALPYVGTTMDEISSSVRGLGAS